MPFQEQYEITSDSLRNLHYEQKLSPQEIADLLGCTRSLTYHYFKKFGIDIRPKNQNLLNKRFGRLAVQDFWGINNNHQAEWQCKCDCGKTTIATTGQLNNGLQSCGCYCKDKITSHGMSNSRPYRIWLAMKSRCDNPNAWNHERYGSRGISYCECWNNFENFWNDMKDGYLSDKTLHRLDNNDNYNPDNCCWATINQQNNLKRNSVMLTCNGQTMNATQWAERLNIPRHVIYARKERGWSDEEILTRPIRKRS